MISGVLYVLLVGLMWGLIFVGLLIVLDYLVFLQLMGCYLVLGLIVLLIVWLGCMWLCQLMCKDWFIVLLLILMGNVIYYVCFVSVIQ